MIYLIAKPAPPSVWYVYYDKETGEWNELECNATWYRSRLAAEKDALELKGIVIASLIDED